MLETAKFFLFCKRYISGRQSSLSRQTKMRPAGTTENTQNCYCLMTEKIPESYKGSKIFFNNSCQHPLAGFTSTSKNMPKGVGRFFFSAAATFS